MITNNKYYFKAKNEEKIIPIGDKKTLWKPLFHETIYYKSVKEIKLFYNDNNEEFIICDEFNKELTFKELENELINWNNGNIRGIGRYTQLIGQLRYYYSDSEGYDFSRMHPVTL